jgi:uncharacterized membrane protein
MVAIFAIACLFTLGFFKGVMVAEAIATVALGVAGANSAEGIFSKKPNQEKEVKKLAEENQKPTKKS